MGQDAEQLVRKAKKGDSQAFTALVLQNEHMLARTATTILRNTDDAADAVQEAVLEAWRKLGGLRQTRYFKTWLVRILIHKCYDLCEERDKHRHSELESALNAEEEDDRDTALDVRAVLDGLGEDDRDTALDVRAVLDGLGEDDRLLLGLFYFDGLSVREIAKALNLSEAAVKQRLHRGRRRFQTNYLQQEELCHEE